MTTPDPAPTPANGDRCIRCGAPTPPGIALCPTDNPGKIKGPSTTQVHATILIGIMLGAVALLILLRVASGSGVPFNASVQEAAVDGTGAASIVVVVTNGGAQSAIATCRVTRDGSPRQDDPTYRTERVEAGGSVKLRRTIPAPPAGTAPFDPERMTVSCV